MKQYYTNVAHSLLEGAVTSLGRMNLRTNLSQIGPHVFVHEPPVPMDRAETD